MDFTFEFTAENTPLSGSVIAGGSRALASQKLSLFLCPTLLVITASCTHQTTRAQPDQISQKPTKNNRRYGKMNKGRKKNIRKPIVKPDQGTDNYPAWERIEKHKQCNPSNYDINFSNKFFKRTHIQEFNKFFIRD